MGEKRNKSAQKVKIPVCSLIDCEINRINDREINKQNLANGFIKLRKDSLG